MQTLQALSLLASVVVCTCFNMLVEGMGGGSHLDVAVNGCVSISKFRSEYLCIDISFCHVSACEARLFISVYVYFVPYVLGHWRSLSLTLSAIYHYAL